MSSDERMVTRLEKLLDRLEARQLETESQHNRIMALQAIRVEASIESLDILKGSLDKKGLLQEISELKLSVQEINTKITRIEKEDHPKISALLNGDAEMGIEGVIPTLNRISEEWLEFTKKRDRLIWLWEVFKSFISSWKTFIGFLILLMGAKWEEVAKLIKYLYQISR